jgi:hypothetical protein
MECSRVTREKDLDFRGLWAKKKMSRNETSNPSKKAMASLPVTSKEAKTKKWNESGWTFAAREVQRGRDARTTTRVAQDRQNRGGMGRMPGLEGGGVSGAGG